MADAVAAAPAAAAPAAAPPPAAAIPAEPRPAAPTATAAAGVPAAETPVVPPAAARREQVAGFAQAGALKVAITEVLSPTSATRWRIAVGRPVDYFGPSSQSGRPTDIPAAPAIAAGSSPQDDVCWMVGRGGAVYLTTNGTHFARVTFPDAVDLIAVRATDATTATVTAASGRTYRTTDAGKTWQ